MSHAQLRVADQRHTPGLPGAYRVAGVRLLCDGGVGHALEHGGHHRRRLRLTTGSVDHPVAGGLYDRVVRGCQATTGVHTGTGPQRRTESLVAPLVQGEQPVHGCICRVGRIPFGTAVDRQCAQHGSAGVGCIMDQLREPWRRDQVQQRRRRDELGPLGGDGGQAAAEIGADRDQFGAEPAAHHAQPGAIAVAGVEPVPKVMCPPGHGLRQRGEQGRVVVDQLPGLCTA